MRLAFAAATVLSSLALLAVAPAHAAQPTGRYLVVFDEPQAARSSSVLSAVLARTGVVRAGRGVPELGIATVRGGQAALSRLRGDRAVESVSVEWARDLRRTPNDPALSTPETVSTNGVPAGTPIQWALARENFPAAWDVTTGDGALVGVIDSGVDGNHPELAGKIASADGVGAANPLTDTDGHGTHVAGLACAGTDNGIGIAGAGWGCRLAIVKLGSTGFGVIRDEDIIDGIRVATERGAQAINMSFGGGATNAALREAIEFAVSRDVVLVAAASNDATADQGAPAVELQPGDGPLLEAGRGLVVTAAGFDDARAGTGFGPQISVAAYGFFDDGPLGPPGLVSTFPGNPTSREGGLFGGCECRRALGGDSRYAYLAGTSMATPQVTALAAMIADLNPFLTLREKLTLIKAGARGGGAWGPDLGWGIIDAGRTVDAARRIDRSPPFSRARAKRRVRLRPGARRAPLRLRWAGSDPGGAPGLIGSGVTRYDVYVRRGAGRPRRMLTSTRRRSALPRLRPGVYRFFTTARDRAGNLEARPPRHDVRVVVRR